MTSPAPEGGLQLGALALGSSNDYHKPFRSDQQIDGISCKIDFSHTQPRDVGLLGHEDEQGQWQTRHWIINAGLGLTAEANALFNEPSLVLDVLKRRSTSAAILYAAIRTTLRFRNGDRLVQVASQPWMSTIVTNIGVVKSPHFSGGFSYDSDFDPASGRFHVHLCENMPLPLVLFTLWQLSRQRFNDLPRTRSWQTNHLVVTADNPFAVELDGEVIHSKKVAFAIADRRLEVCV
jgi:diacylglycerol kinase family enzyme